MGAVDRILRACRGHEDCRALRLALLDELRGAIPFDAYAWLLTDPETEVGSAPLADVPCLPELPRLVRLKYQTGVNRWTGLDGAVALLREATADRPERSLVWREMLAGLGVSDVASVVYRDRFGCWGFLDLWRTGSGARFNEAEAELLTATAPAVTGAIRRCQARTFDQQAPRPAEGRAGPAVLVLTPELEVRAQTPETEGYLRALLPPDADRRPIPAAAYNVAAQLVAVESGIDDHPAMARVHLVGGTWLTVRGARIATAAPAGEQEVAVTIERASPAERTDLFVRCHGLSAREAELLGHLAAGDDTRRIAGAMFLSEHTVQDHLKAIFAKTGVRSRRALLARAVGL